ncbi:hypothetical protein V6Z11_D05G312600 [Gossypium hirsutum]|uniref:Cyclin-dependent protein kinase inhibitor SIM n=1 Tax=Gossypium hirsutum TaxID=3635 RepID=A0A1U8J1B0_GOSHI|nr:cyclin-dependent protein kinase inhibitor SIM [Gossypium hirsutum]
MSTDLELFQDSLKIKLPKLKIIQSSDENGTGVEQLNKKGNNSVEFCATPTSDENKIPPVLSCPAAPTKPKRTASVSCKRKLFQNFNFFEIVNSEEVDAFFKAGFHASSSKKRSALIGLKL